MNELEGAALLFVDKLKKFGGTLTFDEFDTKVASRELYPFPFSLTIAGWGNPYDLARNNLILAAHQAIKMGLVVQENGKYIIKEMIK